MAKPQEKAAFTLEVRRTFAASREALFAAWTHPEKLTRWMCKDVPSHQVTYRELDVRAGGRYVMEIHDTANGEIYVGSGTYLEVTAPEKLVFTWSWLKKAPDGSFVPMDDGTETRVTVEFFVRGASTELVLTHDGFTSQASRQEHDGGWTGCLSELGRFLESAAH